VKLRRRAASVLVAVLLAAGCGASSAAGAGSGTLTVFAASSLGHVFPEIASAFAAAHPGAGVRFSFAGTDALVAQIQAGAPADVFAGASASYGDQLFSDQLVERPVAFCTNRLVVVVPASNPAAIDSLRDLTRPGVKIVVGAETVPVGAYTRKVLASLDALYGPLYSSKVLANVVSNEDNVEGVLTKVRLGEADAGFVYVTDAQLAGGDVHRVELPSQAQAVASYPIAVVRASVHPSLAKAFVDYVLGPDGERRLAAAGFGPPPSPGS